MWFGGRGLLRNSQCFISLFVDGSWWGDGGGRYILILLSVSVFQEKEQGTFNPFTAAACKLSGLKDARTRQQTVYFRSFNTSTFSAMRFDGENPFTCQCQKEDKKGLWV